MAVWFAGAGAGTLGVVARWLREPRPRLVTIYAALVALGYATHVLPGGLDYPRGTGELVFSLLVDVTLVVLIAVGSRAAAAVMLVLNVGLLLSVTLVSSGSDLLRADEIAFVVVLLAQAPVLVRLALWRARPAAPAG
jgi:hypothetical protein